jgi:hypothetical protein
VTARAAGARARLVALGGFDARLALFALYFAFAAYYVWQAWRRESPAIFTDELEMTQISRSIADTGSPARRGVAYGFTSLYPYFTAPAWWIHSTQDAFETIKYLGALTMTAAIFPAYAMARIVLTPRWAVAAATGAIAAPALSYSPILVEEPLAYLVSTIALWLIVRATLRPTRWTIALAAFGSLVAAATRSQLAMLLLVLAAAMATLGWRSERARAMRSGWSRWDWVGVIVLAIGVIIVANAFLSHATFEWEVTTRLYKDRLWTYGTWAGGGLAVGLGVLPVVGGLAALVRKGGEPAEPGRTAFTIVAAAAIALFGWYAALKGAYLSTQFSSEVVERNLIYLDPVLFVGTALLLARRGTRLWWGVACGAFATYLVAHVPYKTASYPYYEAHGLAIAAFANRIFHWADGPIQTTLIILAVVSTALAVFLPRMPRGGRATSALIAAVCAATAVWNVTAETYAANGEYHFSRFLVSRFPRPFDRIERATGGGSTVLVGQQFGSNSNGYNLTEFWNRSIDKVWSIDPTSIAPGPGPTLTPDLVNADGEMTPSPGTEYALAVNDVKLQAPLVPVFPQAPGETLYRLDGGPLRLAFSMSGISPDSWATAPNADTPASAAYNRFDAASLGRGFVVVHVHRTAWNGKDVPTRITIRLGTLVVGEDRQPAIGRTLAVRRLTLHSCVDPNRLVCATGRPFKNPEVPFRIEVTVSRTFVPHDIDPRKSDLRHLGAQIAFVFIPV